MNGRIVLLLLAFVPGCRGGESYPHVTYKKDELPEAEVVIYVPAFAWNGETSAPSIRIPVPATPPVKPGVVIKLRGTIQPTQAGLTAGGILAKIIQPSRTAREHVQSVAVKEMTVYDSEWRYEVDLRAPLKPGIYTLQLFQIWNTPDPVVFATAPLPIASR